MRMGTAMTIKLISLIFITLFFVSFVSAADPYIIGMRNISTQMQYGKANLVIIGDSITSTCSAPNLPYGITRQWSPANWSGMIVCGIAHNLDQGTSLFNEPQSTDANVTNRLPGQPFWDGSSGWNPTQVNMYNWTKDFTAFGTLWRPSIYPPSFVDRRWLNQTSYASAINFSGRMFYLSHGNSTPIRIGAEWMNGSTSGTDVAPRMNDTPVGVYWMDYNIGKSNGSSNMGLQFVGNNVVENITNYSIYQPLYARIWRQDITTGLQLGYIGEGGYTSQSHTRLGELLTIGTQSVNTNFSDAGLRAYVNGTDSNIFMIWVGANDGSSTNYLRNIELIITRYIEIYFQTGANKGKPMFILISTFDQSNSPSKNVEMEAILETIVRNQSNNANFAINASIGMVRFRALMNETNGSWSTWQDDYLRDGVHFNALGANVSAQYLWNQFIQANTVINRSHGNFNYTVQSYTVTNSTSSTTLVLNNTDVYAQMVNFTGLTNARLYDSGGTIASGITGDYNYSMPRESLLFLDDEVVDSTAVIDSAACDGVERTFDSTVSMFALLVIAVMGGFIFLVLNGTIELDGLAFMVALTAGIGILLVAIVTLIFGITFFYSLTGC